MRTTHPGADHENNGRRPIFGRFTLSAGEQGDSGARLEGAGSIDIGRIASGAAVLRRMDVTPSYEDLLAQRGRVVPMAGGGVVLHAFPDFNARPGQA